MGSMLFTSPSKRCYLLLLLFLGFSAALGTSETKHPAKVPVTFWSMAFCPCSAQLAFNFNASIWSNPELRAVIDFKQPWSAIAGPKDTVRCFHTGKECRFVKWLLCAQKQDFAKAFNWELCVDGYCNNNFKFPIPMHPCKTQYSNPDNIPLSKECATKHGLDWERLAKCALSKEGDQLLLEDAKEFKKIYGAQGLPPVEINGKIITKFAECSKSMDDILKAICDAIEGKKPKACSAVSAVEPNSVHFPEYTNEVLKFQAGNSSF